MNWITSHKREVVILALVLFLCYVVGYFIISRYSLNQWEASYGERYFLYVPLNPHVVLSSDALITVHYVLAYFYYPLWWLDHNVLHGPAWVKPGEGAIGS